MILVVAEKCKHREKRRKLVLGKKYSCCANMTTIFLFCKQTSQSLQYLKGKSTDGISCVPVSIHAKF